MEPFVKGVLLLSAMFLTVFITAGFYTYKKLKPIWSHEKCSTLWAVLIGASFLLIGCILGIVF